MTETGPHYDAFISYSRRNIEAVEVIHSALQAQGLRVWMDRQDIPPTVDWWNQIQHGIRSSHNIVFCVSPDSMASPICHQELDYARQLGRYLIAVIIIEGEGGFDGDKTAALVRIAGEPLDDLSVERLHGRDLLAIARDNFNDVQRANWVFCRSDDERTASIDGIVAGIREDETHRRSFTEYSNQALNWLSDEQSPDRLLKGREIDEAEAWLAAASGKKPAPTPLIEEFIETSRQVEEAHKARDIEIKNEEKRLRRSRRRARRFALGFGTVVTLVLVVLLIFGLNQLRLRNESMDPMIRFPAATVLLGEDAERIELVRDAGWELDYQPQQSIKIGAFALDQYEVSFADYGRCVEAGICDAADGLPDAEEVPGWSVVGVSGLDAATYCAWLGKRLPTRAEWERAARGENGREWPWGSDLISDVPPVHMFSAALMISGDSDLMMFPAPVAVDDARFVDGATPEGVIHLMGNAAEWTATPADSRLCADPYTCLAWDGGTEDVQLYVVGFSYIDDFDDVYVSPGGATPAQASERNAFTGFRCAADSE